MIANHNQLFHFSDPSKSVETLTSRRLDWSWSVTKLKAIFQILFVQVFLLLVKETKFKIFIGFFSHREVSIFYSNGGSTARAC